MSTRFNKTCDQVVAALGAAGIPAVRLRGDTQVASAVVSVGTIHAFKGAERCLLFVACTRARDGLYVSWFGRPSRFLLEAVL